MAFQGDAFQNDAFQVASGAAEAVVIGGSPPGLVVMYAVPVGSAEASFPGGSASGPVPAGAASHSIPEH